MPGGVQLTPNFTLDEFRCPCCGLVIASNALTLAQHLQQVRDYYGPMTISSGTRCPKHNAKVRSKPTSLHLTGLAADIACNTASARYQLLRCLLRCNFERIGIAARHIHVDLGATGPAIWTYYA